MSGRTRLVVISTLAILLSSSTLTSLFETWDWLVPVIAAVLVVVAASEGARRVGVARAFVPVVALAALIIWLVATTASSVAPYGFVPSPAAIRRLSDLLGEGFRAIDTYSAPVFPTRGLILMTAGGIGLVAVVVDLLAVTLRRPALAGLPLLALYGVPAGLAPHGVPATAFGLGAAGYLLLLLAESRERVVRWGRPLEESTPSGSDDASPLLALGRRVGLGAVVAAIVIPVLVPGLNGGVLAWGSGTGIGGGSGGGGVKTAVNPVITLKDDLVRKDKRVILHYTSTAATAPYIRLVALDTYDGTTWSPRTLKGFRNDAQKKITSGWFPPEQVAGVTTKTKIQVENTFSSLWLPMPYPAAKVSDAKGSWVYDPDTLNTYSRNRDVHGLKYTVDSYDVNLTSADLDKLSSSPTASAYRPDERYLATPTVDPKVFQLAADVVAGAKATTPYDQALALQNYLRRNYTYDTDAPGGVGEVQLENFLLRDRRGFCTHFATSMAVMARTLGIPSRVAVGFLPGVDDGRTKDGLHEHVITTGDTHAWPELYFAGAGWLRFEPTPGNGAIGPAYAPTNVPSTVNGGASAIIPNPFGSGAASADPSAVAAAARNGRDRGGNVSTAGAVAQNISNHIPWRALTLLPLLALLALLPAAWRTLVRRRRWAKATTPAAVIEAAWAELTDSVVDRGHEIDPRETPRGFAARVADDAALYTEPAAALHRIARIEERHRYAREVGDVSGVREDLAAVIAGLDEDAGLLDKLRARWMPASSASALHVVGGWFADLFDGLDRGISRARGRVLPHRG